MNLYRIRDWSQHFENSRTRQLDILHWVPVPNKHDGESFRRIMAMPDGLEIYGCWHLILQVASKCHPRGTLVRPDKTPLDATSIGFKTGADAKKLSKALTVLASSEISWIECVASECHCDGTQVALGSMEMPLNGMEGNGTDLKGTEVPPDGGGDKPSPVKVAKPDNPNFVAFRDGFIQRYADVFGGAKYAFQGGKDGSAVKKLIGMGITIPDLIDIAAFGMTHRESFISGQCREISGFASVINRVIPDWNGGKKDYQGRQFGKPAQVNQRNLQMGIDEAEAVRLGQKTVEILKRRAAQGNGVA